VLSLDVKKFFMDEWTGEPSLEMVAAIGAALSATVPVILAALEDLS